MALTVEKRKTLKAGHFKYMFGANDVYTSPFASDVQTVKVIRVCQCCGIPSTATLLYRSGKFLKNEDPTNVPVRVRKWLLGLLKRK